MHEEHTFMNSCMWEQSTVCAQAHSIANTMNKYSAILDRRVSGQRFTGNRKLRTRTIHITTDELDNVIGVEKNQLSGIDMVGVGATPFIIFV